jgi:hypothetical protein
MCEVLTLLTLTWLEVRSLVMVVEKPIKQVLKIKISKANGYRVVLNHNCIVVWLILWLGLSRRELISIVGASEAVKGCEERK